MRAHLTQDETDQLRALLSQEGVRRAVGWAKERISTERGPGWSEPSGSTGWRAVVGWAMIG